MAYTINVFDGDHLEVQRNEEKERDKQNVQEFLFQGVQQDIPGLDLNVLHQIENFHEVVKAVLASPQILFLFLVPFTVEAIGVDEIVGLHLLHVSPHLPQIPLRHLINLLVRTHHHFGVQHAHVTERDGNLKPFGICRRHIHDRDESLVFILIHYGRYCVLIEVFVFSHLCVDILDEFCVEGVVAFDGCEEEGGGLVFCFSSVAALCAHAVVAGEYKDGIVGHFSVDVFCELTKLFQFFVGLGAAGGERVADVVEADEVA